MLIHVTVHRLHIIASIIYPEELRQTIIYFVIDNALIEFESQDFIGLIDSLVDLYDLQFGFAFQLKFREYPVQYIIGADSGCLNDQEKSALFNWYKSGAKERQTFLRDVYPINIINESQMNIKIRGDETLGEYAHRNDNMLIRKINNKPLYLWVIDNEVDINVTRETLKKLNSLIAFKN